MAPVSSCNTRKAQFSCPMMSLEEAAAMTVPCSEVGTMLRPILERFGAAIVTDVLSKSECEEFERLFVSDLQGLIDNDAMRKADSEMTEVARRASEEVHSLPLATAECLGAINRCQLRGLPHGRFAWAGRLHPNVRRCYEVMHETKKLVSSCDNSFFAPDADGEQATNKNWPHVDHNNNDNSIFDEDGVPVSEWEVYQGLLYVWGCTSPHSSTTALWCGSHREVYDEMMADAKMQKQGRKGAHFSRIVESIKSEELSVKLVSQWRHAARRMPMPAGSLLLWSSKTLHQGWSGGPRLAQPVCWEPTKRRSQKARETKLRLAALGLPSTHWASLGLPHTIVNIKPVEPTVVRHTQKGVALPLRSSLQPATLAPGVSVEQMWQQFMRPDWEKPLPKHLRDLLLKSLTEETINVL